MNKILLFIIGIFFLQSCNNTDSKANISAGDILMVVEIPAGTNRKIEVNKTTGEFETDKIDGTDRIINFLPYPGNYGFIPGTLMDEARGGDGDALDVLLIGESLPTGTKIRIQPIATLMLKDNGEIDTKIIAIPADSSKVVLTAYDFATFSVEHRAAKKIIEDWFLNYKGVGIMKLVGWRDQRHAIREIKKWRLKN